MTSVCPTYHSHFFTAAIALSVVLGICAVLACPARAYAFEEVFALLADTHLGLPNNTTYEETEQALAWAGSLKDLKAVCVAGDLTDRGDAVSYSEWEYLCDSLTSKAVRIQALGDHDTGKNGIYLGVDSSLTVVDGYRNFKLVNNGANAAFKKFENANVITLGGIKAKGHRVITSKKLKELDQRLRKTARQGKMAIVICHYPYDSLALNMRSKLMGILRSYPNVIYVSGHRHIYSAMDQCHQALPKCTKNPYGRTGFDSSKKYPFWSIGVNACSTYRSGNYSYADSLSVSSTGKITVMKWNLTKYRIEKAWTFKQPRSSVTIKREGGSGSSALMCRITFSDGGTYSGVASGSTLSLKRGASKRFESIPSGVLVRVQVVNSKTQSASSTYVAEVTKSPRTISIS